MAIDLAKTAFEARITNNEWDNLCNVTGKYQVSATDTACPAGTLVVRGSKLPCEGFSGVYNENAFIMTPATDADNIDSVVYASNTYDSQLISDGVNNWHVGHKTLGLGIPAGRRGTFTKINFDNESVYRFGVGNADDATGTYFSIDDGYLKKEASALATAGAIYFEKVGSGTFTEGTSASFGYVDLRACRCSVSA